MRFAHSAKAGGEAGGRREGIAGSLSASSGVV